MEIDVVYLKALIQDCQDPIFVIQQSNLPGEAQSEQHAREVLISHFSQPHQYTHEEHAAHIEAMRWLGVDVPVDESVSVLNRKNTGPA